MAVNVHSPGIVSIATVQTQVIQGLRVIPVSLRDFLISFKTVILETGVLAMILLLSLIWLECTLNSSLK